MAEVKIRRLDEDVARALRARARERGVSLEEEARRTLGESVVTKLRAFARRAAASRAATRPPRGKVPSDSAVLIRKDRDAWG
jgi:plasmid stability protein